MHTRESADKLLAYCREHGRVCPEPGRWNKLWEQLPDRVRVGGGWEPPLPLILGAWNYTSDEEKSERLAEHIEWAFSRGALAVIAGFLLNLSEDDWHHHQ